MVWATSPRFGSGSGSKRDDQRAGQSQAINVQASARFSSYGMSPFSSNASGDRQRSLDMDPEAVSHVWIPDRQDVWRLARLEKLTKEMATVSVPGICDESFDVPRAHTRVWDPSHSLYLEDAAKLNSLHEAALLSLLHTRFANDDIYTYTGDVLISVNPYKTIPLLYTMPHDNSDKINRRITQGAGRLSELERMCAAGAEDSDCDDGDDPNDPIRKGTELEGSAASDPSAVNGGMSSKSSSFRAAGRASGGARSVNSVTFSDNVGHDGGRRSDGASPPGGARGSESGSIGGDIEDDSVLNHPHVYAVADKAHRFMTEPEPAQGSGGAAGRRKRDQSIIITGESGAGKTEAAKYVMKYLIAASKAVVIDGDAKNGGGVHRKGTRSGDDGGTGDMERCLLESTVVLESFGNAKTVRNDNSSRFGKYIKLQYGANWRLRGARTLPFLLEKSRLVHQEHNERNYHVFYQLCQGVPQHLWEGLHLSNAPDFDMLNKGGVFLQSDEVDDAEEFRGLASALTTLGVTSKEQEGLWQLLAALLHIGNIRFVEATEEVRGENGMGVRLEPQLVTVEEIARMAGLPAHRLVSSMRKKVAMTGRGSFLEIPLDPTQARDNRNGLVKHVYGQVFNWLVGKVNEAHGPGGTSGEGIDTETVAFVGILDIFGFEIMVRNSFEQLCINFANEVLQQQFNSHVFVLEQEEYEKEGLDWAMIEFKDNQPVIDLISKKPKGLLIQLEEQGLLGRRANNKALLQLYHNTHLSKNACYSKPRFDSTEFIILHFAGEVVYDIEGFLEKNNDSLHDNLLDLLDATEDPFLRSVIDFVDPGAAMEPSGFGSGYGNLSPVVSPARSPLSPANMRNGTLSPARSPVSPLPGGSGNVGSVGQGLRPFSFQDGSPTQAYGSSPGSGRKGDRQERSKARNSGRAGPRDRVSQMSSAITVSKAFRGQLQSLMATLRATEPHYIKCIKPNNVKAPGGFSSHLVHQQLNYSGVLEVVRIRREAYPGRTAFLEFYERFELLQHQLVQASVKGQAIIGTAPSRGGNPTTGGGKKGMLDLPPPGHATEAEAKDACRTILESFLPHKFFQIGETRVFLKEEGQDMLRGAMRGVYNRKAALIQACVRAMQGSAKLKEKKRAAIIIHAAARMYLARSRFRRVVTQVKFLQRWYRSRSVRHKYKGCIASAVMIQKHVRGMQARERLIVMEVAAIIIQRHVRGMAARRLVAGMLYDRWMEEEENRRKAEEFKKRRAQAIIRAWMRRMIAKYGAKAQDAAARRIQRVWMRRARNRWLQERVGRVFAMARAGDVDGMTRELRSNPDVLYMRDRHDRFKTLLHLAAMSGSTSLVSLLDPLPEDVLALDADGCTPLHHAAASCKYDVVKFLASRANGRVHAPARIRTDSVDAFMHETRVTKRISMKIIQEARQRIGRPAVRTGGVWGTVAGGAATRRGLAARTNDDVQPAMTSSKPVFQGFLFKRRETGAWQKRWCVLTERDMEYYHSRQDHVKGKRPAKSVALNSALLKKSGPPPALPARPVGVNTSVGGPAGFGPSITGGFGSNGSSGTGGFGSNGGISPRNGMYVPHSPFSSPRAGWSVPTTSGVGTGAQDSAKSKQAADLAHCFELHSGKLLGDKRNREGRLYFKASSEEELYAWLVPLRVLVGSHNLRRTGAAGPMCYVDVARRAQLVNCRNKAGETPLHYSTKGEGRTERDAIGRVQIAAWLVENGCDPNGIDNKGATTLHAAVSRDHVPLAAALARRGGDLTIRDEEGHRPLDLVKREQDVQDVSVGHYKAAERSPMLGAPVKLSSLTYLSFHLERLVMHSTAELQCPFITICVHDSRGRKVEASQDATAPVVRRPNYLWWASTYHMQNPVENLEPGTVLVFTVKDLSTEFLSSSSRPVAGGGSVRELGWGMLRVSRNTMNSQEVSMEMYQAPVDLSQKALVPIDLFLSGYVTLTTAQQDMDTIANAHASAQG